MRLQIETGNLSLTVDCSEYDHSENDEQMVGEGSATVPLALYLNLREEWGFDDYTDSSVEDLKQQLEENQDETIALTADALIVFLNAAAHQKKSQLEIDYDGLAPWFCHDVIHSQNDVHGGTIEVNDTAENRALYEGAMLAAKSGVPIVDIVTQLSKAETAYRLRFNDAEPNALDRFLRHCKFSLDN